MSYKKAIAPASMVLTKKFSLLINVFIPLVYSTRVFGYPYSVQLG